MNAIVSLEVDFKTNIHTVDDVDTLPTRRLRMNKCNKFLAVLARPLLLVDPKDNTLELYRATSTMTRSIPCPKLQPHTKLQASVTLKVASVLVANTQRTKAALALKYHQLPCARRFDDVLVVNVACLVLYETLDESTIP